MSLPKRQSSALGGVRATHVVLTAFDQRRLTATLETLLQPLGEPLGTWCHCVLSAVKELVGADSVGASIPTQQGVLVCSPDKPLVWSQYAGMLEPMDRKFKIVERGRALGVYNREMLWPDLPAYYASDYYNEYIVPHRMYDALCMLVSESDRPEIYNAAQLIAHHERLSGQTFGERGLLLFRLIRPAFEAAVRNQLAFARHEKALGRMLDSLSEGVLLCDERARVLHMSTSLDRMLQSDDDGERLRQAIHSTAATLARLLRPSPAETLARDGHSLATNIRTPKGRYTIRGVMLPATLLGGSARLLVSLVRQSAELPTIEDLCARFGLTQRQAHVALLLAEGQTNERIAAVLSLSAHTVRHHTEVVLAKLGVHSRAEVASLLLR